jgi:hypothetical protein
MSKRQARAVRPWETEGSAYILNRAFTSLVFGIEHPERNGGNGSAEEVGR